MSILKVILGKDVNNVSDETEVHFVIYNNNVKNIFFLFFINFLSFILFFIYKIHIINIINIII